MHSKHIAFTRYKCSLKYSNHCLIKRRSKPIRDRDPIQKLSLQTLRRLGNWFVCLFVLTQHGISVSVVSVAGKSICLFVFNWVWKTQHGISVSVVSVAGKSICLFVFNWVWYLLLLLLH